MMDGYLILDKCDSNQFLELNITFEGISKLRNMIFECKMKKNDNENPIIKIFNIYFDTK